MQQVPGVPPRPVSQNRQELRLALSLRGGVSLAVWMGGAIAEIDRVTQATPRAFDRDLVEHEGVADPYALLLHLTGYTGVAVDVITGASAGGLNAVIYAAAKVYGFDFDDMLRVWVELGDIEALSRSPVSKGAGNPPSLLQGDGYFQEQLRQNLANRIADPHNAEGTTNPIDLILSATLADPVTVLRTDDPYSTIEEERRMASFHFRYAGTTASRSGHFEPAAKAAEIERADSTASLLALAGRATSSFPVAFEPASVPYAARRVFSDAPEHEHLPPLQVLDGGVLDNIPVGKAIEAIGATAALGPTDRCLLFLHPDPGDPAKERAKREAAGSATLRAFATLKRTFTATWSQESLLADLIELEDHNREAEYQRLRREAIFERFEALPPGEKLAQALIDAADVQTQTATTIRSSLDADAIIRALDGGDDGEGVLAPLRRLSLDPTDRELLAHIIGDWLRSHAPRGPRRDPEALRRAADQLIGLSKEIELVIDDAPHPQAVAAAGTAKRTVYRTRLVATHLAALVRRSWVVQAGDQLPMDLVEFVDTSGAYAGGLPTKIPATVGTNLLAVLRVAAGNDPERTQRHADAHADDEIEVLDALERMDDAVLAQLAHPGDLHGTIDLIEPLWRQLISAAEQLASEMRGIDELAALSVAQRALASARAGTVGDVLDAIVVLTAPLAAATLQGDSAIRFFRIAGTNATPLAEQLGGTVGVNEKLCGNQLANFSAFFSARWRANDWMWGRLDAAATLVNLLVDSRRLARFNPGHPLMVAEAVAAIADSSGVTLDAASRHLIEAELVGAFSDDEIPRPLNETKRVLVESLQRRIFGQLLDTVISLGDRPEPVAATPPVPPPEQLGARLDERLATFRVGRESFGDLNPTRRTQIGMRLAMVAAKAFQPEGPKTRARWVRASMRIVKPIWLFGAFTALLLRRGLFLLIVIMAGLLDGPWQRGLGPSKPWTTFVRHHRKVTPKTQESDGSMIELRRLWRAPWSHRIAFVLVVALLVVAIVRLHELWRRPHSSWYVLSVGSGVAALALGASRYTLGPLTVTIGAMVVATLATTWMSPLDCTITALGTGLAYAGSGVAMWALEHGTKNAAHDGHLLSWWAVVALALAAGTITVQCSVRDVFPKVQPTTKDRAGQAARS